MPNIRAFFDDATNKVSYLVADPTTREAAVIDAVLDYDHTTGCRHFRWSTDASNAYFEPPDKEP